MKSKRQFAYGTTRGPDIVNLQLGFWKDALATFAEIENNWNRYAVEGPSEADDEGPYTKNEFRVDAARAIVLAGTSISILVGHRAPAETKEDGSLWTMMPQDALRHLVGELSEDHEKLIRAYEDIRHFGSCKYDTLHELTPDALCHLMRVAQDIWKTVLPDLDEEERALFTTDFDLK